MNGAGIRRAEGRWCFLCRWGTCASAMAGGTWPPICWYVSASTLSSTPSGVWGLRGRSWSTSSSRAGISPPVWRHARTMAGAYVYGRWEYSGETRSPTTGKARAHLRGAADWPVCIHNHHDAYLSWEEYVQNCEQLRHNWYREGQRGAVREGTALLQGIVSCGICGRNMSVQHHAAGERRAPTYLCAQGYQDGERHICQSMTARPVDAAVVAVFLEAVASLQLDVAVQVLDQIEQQIAVERRQWELQIEQAHYAARLAQR